MPGDALAVLVEDISVFDYDGEFYFETCPRSGQRRAYTEDRFCETLARMADIVRRTRIAGQLSADVIPIMRSRFNPR